MSHIPSPTSPIRRIGLISDTHGLVRPEVHGALAAVEMIPDIFRTVGNVTLDVAVTSAVDRGEGGKQAASA